MKALNDAHLNNVFLDVALVSGKSEFEVHQVVLAFQSSFFETHCEEQWETSDNRIGMSDLSPQILGAIVNSTYTGEVTNINYISPELFVTAERYQLPTLKTLCEQSLWKLMTINSSVCFTKMTTTYNASKLRDQIFGFSVPKRKGWKKLDECVPI